MLPHLHLGSIGDKVWPVRNYQRHEYDNEELFNQYWQDHLKNGKNREEDKCDGEEVELVE